jgi:hypothetical protein
MGTARLLTQNRIATSVLTASSFQPLLAPSNLQSFDLQAKVWRTLDDVGAASFVADMGSIDLCECVALLASNGGSSTTFRIRLSTSDATGAAGDAYDSGVLAGAFDPSYRHFIHYLPQGSSGRYLRGDIAETESSFIQAGALMAGAYWDPSCAFQFGFNSGTTDMDEITRTRGGVEYVNAGAAYRFWKGSFAALTQLERDTELDYIERIVRRRLPIVFTKDKASANLGRDSIVGRLQDPPEFPNNSGPFYTWAVNIAELS